MSGDMEKSRDMSDASEKNEIDEHEATHPSANSFTEAEKQAVIRKLDRRLLPFVFFLYVLAVLDRSNLGNARLAGLADEVDISGLRYNWLGTAFYIAYILFQWTTLGWKQFKPHQWCTFVVIGWGFVASIQAVVSNFAGLVTCRVFLAIFEACFGPGVPLYLTYFYPRDRVAFRHGVFVSGAAMANAIGGALAYGIVQIRGSIAPWKILFLIEGLPTIVVGVAAWFVLPDSVMEAKFLSQREKEVALHFVAQNQRLDTGEKTHGIRPREVWAGLKDPKSFIPALCYFGCNVSFASLPLFLPTIIEQLGFHPRGSGAGNGLSAPPYLFCFLWIILVCWLSDRFGIRGPFCALSAGMSGIGFVILATTQNVAAKYFGAFLAVLIFASVALLLAWTANIHNTESKRAGGYILLYTVGQCGPLLGTNVFPSSERPRYVKGMSISAAFSFFVCVMSIILSSWLIWENKKMAKEGVPEVEEFEQTSAGTGDAVVKKNRYIW